MPRLGSTRSLRSRLKMSDQSSSGATRRPDCLRLASERFGVRTAAERQAVEKVDAGMAPKRIAHGEPLRRLERIGLPAAKDERLRAGDMGGERDQRGAILDQALQRRVGPIPLQHREFRRVQRRRSRLRKTLRQREDLLLAGGEQLLHREFRRGMQIGVARRAVRRNERRREAVQMGLVAGRSLEGGGLDLDETLGVEPAPHEARDPRAGDEAGRAVGVAVPVPERSRGGRAQGTPAASRQRRSKSIPTGLWRQNRYGARRNRQSGRLRQAPFVAARSDARQFRGQRRESYRKLDSQGQYHRARGRSALRRSFRRKLSSRARARRRPRSTCAASPTGSR